MLASYKIAFVLENSLHLRKEPRSKQFASEEKKKIVNLFAEDDLK
jgi:hypothetical protein